MQLDQSFLRTTCSAHRESYVLPCFNTIYVFLQRIDILYFRFQMSNYNISSWLSPENSS